MHPDLRKKLIKALAENQDQPVGFNEEELIKCSPVICEGAFSQKLLEDYLGITQSRAQFLNPNLERIR
jgi:hypothetical protein